MSTQSVSLYGPSVFPTRTIKSDWWQDDQFEEQIQPDLSSPELSKEFWARIRGTNKPPSAPNTWGILAASFAALKQDDLLAVVLERQIQELRQSYALLSNDALIGAAFQDAPALFSLLTGAVEPLRSIFGNEGLFQLEALESDEGTILRVIAKLPHDASNAAELMSKFNRDWWINNCARSQASLVFDYETGDAV